MVNFRSAFDLRGRVAIITGAASGIGRAMAEAFHERGLHVVLIDRSATVSKVADGLGDRASGWAVDATDEEAVSATVASVLLAHGQVDVLVNNAGVGRWGRPRARAWRISTARSRLICQASTLWRVPRRLTCSRALTGA